VVSAWWPSRIHEPVPLQGLYSGKRAAGRDGGQADSQLQGEFVSPVRGVLNCYDMDDFAHARGIPVRA